MAELINSEWFAAALKDPQRVHFLVQQQLIMVQTQPRIVREHYFSVAAVVVDMFLEDMPELRAEVIDALQADIVTGSEIDPRSAYTAETVGATATAGGGALAGLATAEVVLPDEIMWGALAAPVFAQDGDTPEKKQQQPARAARSRSPSPSRARSVKKGQAVEEKLNEVRKDAEVPKSYMKEMAKWVAANAGDAYAIGWSVMSIGVTALAVIYNYPLVAVRALRWVDYSLLPTATDKLVRSYSRDSSRKLIGFIILAVCCAALFLPGFVDASFTRFRDQQNAAATVCEARLVVAEQELGVSSLSVHAAARTAQALLTGSDDSRKSVLAELGKKTRSLTAEWGLPLTNTYPIIKAWTRRVESVSSILPETLNSSISAWRAGCDFIDDRIASVQVSDGVMAVTARKAWNVVEVALLPYECQGHRDQSLMIMEEGSMLKSALQLMWKPIIINGIQQMFLLAAGLGITSGTLGTLQRKIRERLRGGVNSQKVGLRLTLQEPNVIERTYNAVFSNRYVSGALDNVNRYVLSPQINAFAMAHAIALLPVAKHAATQLYHVMKGFDPATPITEVAADPTVVQALLGYVDSFMQTVGPLAQSALMFHQDTGRDMTLVEHHASPVDAVEAAIDEGNLAAVLRLLPTRMWTNGETMDFVAVAVGATMAVDRASIPQLMILKAVLSLPQIPWGTPPISDEQAKMLMVDLLLSGEDDATLARLLLHYGADPNFRDADGTSLLIVAIGHNEKAIIQALLQAGAEVNLRGPDGVTPLQVAVAMRDPPVELDVLRILLAAGASVYSESPELKAPIIFALEGDTTAVNEIVLRHTLTKATPAPPAELRAAIERRLHNTSGPVRRSLQF